ncbi:MAG: Glucosyl-3-phosphoglycerate synthase [Verrucomicrobiota bacterium]
MKRKVLHSSDCKGAKPTRSSRSPGVGKALVSVVIPVLNESRTVGQVVRFARTSPVVGEVLVIDDGSIDGTAELAEKAGARVITSSLLGKGASMEDGIHEACHDLILFLDGDLRGLESGLIERMVQPLIAGDADFAKARFKRSSGRVTLLTAKPLLRTYFPELADIAQPLGGIIAARTELLRNLRLENDYGVDIGLLIDATQSRARIVEVDIGHVMHDSQSLDALEEMAIQVARTILQRAGEWGRLRIRHVQAANERDRVRRADFRRTLDLLNGASRLALIDMDGTLLNARFVMALADRTGRTERLIPLLDSPNLSATARTRKIAALFAGVPKAVFEEVARGLPLNRGAVEMVVGLRKAGYAVGIVTDSYSIAAEVIRRRVFADFTISHVLTFRNDRSTGGITLCPAMRHPSGCHHHTLCKVNVLHHLRDEVGISPARIIAVGDSSNDICLLQAAGRSVAFEPKTPEVRQAAKRVVERDLRGILDYLGIPSSRKPEIRDYPNSLEPFPPGADTGS